MPELVEDRVIRIERVRPDLIEESFHESPDIAAVAGKLHREDESVVAHHRS